jgi:GAF domain-containing protein
LTLFYAAVKLKSARFHHLSRNSTVTAHLQSANVVLSSVKERLAATAKEQPAEVLNGVIETLSEGRGYSWTGIYLAVENLGVRQSASGPAPDSATMAGLKAEIAVPIKLGARTLGLIIAETGRTTGAARQDRTLLQQVTKLIAQYLTTNRAKQLLRKTRENLQAGPRTTEHKGPQSERPAARKAAAGERFPR